MRWSLLRPARSLSQPEGDIDLLVEPGSLQVVRRVVLDEGFAAIPVAGDDLHGADYDAASDRFLWLHVQPQLRLGGEAVAAHDVLAELQRDPLPRPGDRWLLWILLLHGLLEGHDRGAPPRGGDAARACGPSTARAARGVLARRGPAAELVLKLAAAGEWQRLGALAPKAAVRRPSRIAQLAGAPRHGRELWARRGIAVAVIGPDGAGKTTLVDGLRDALPFPTRVLYMGLTGGRLPRADALRVPGVVLAARLAILWVRWGAGLLHRLRGRVVLFDRYVLDGTVPSGVRLSPLAQISRRMQAAACPRPDLVLLLDASGATMHARKGEYDAARLEDWRSAYQRLRGRVKRPQMLDAERPADAVRRDALALVWRSWVERRQAQPR